MKYNQSLSKAKEYSEMAMERIAKENLPPTPSIFELWYVYYSGVDAEVVRAIDIVAAGGYEMTEERCVELHNRFLNTNAKSEEALSKAESLVNETLENVSSVANAVKTSTTSYNTQLEVNTLSVEGAKTPEEMRAVVSKMIEDSKRMVEENRKLEQQLSQSSSVMDKLREEMESVKRDAMTDALTGVANRKQFDMEFYRMVNESHVTGKPLCLLMVDIDYFKSFNDTYGHQVGDQVLRLVARTLKDGVKGQDLPARYGGEEFAVVLPLTSLQDGVNLGNQLREAVANKEVINRATGQKLGRITMSVGAAQLGLAEKPAELIERADSALYRAKHAGRNQVIAAEPPKPKRIKHTG